MKGLFDIRDRKYGLPSRLYTKCFVGNEAVQMMVGKGIDMDERDAVNIGNMLLTAGIFSHVLNEHPFEDKHCSTDSPLMRSMGLTPESPTAAM